MSLIRFPLEEVFGTGIIREREFRAKLNALDWKPYRDCAVLIPWIHDREVPIWAYLMVVARLSEVVGVLSFGEACSPTVLLQKRRNPVPF